MANRNSGTDRRDFLKKAAVAATAGLGALAGAATPAFAQDGDTNEDLAPHDQVPRRTLGNTGETIPILLFGCAQTFDPRYDRMLHRGFNEGIDYLDTALQYANGRSHTTLAPFISQVGRDNLWITTKGPHRRNRATPDTYTRDLDTCLEQMEIDQADLYFMHALNDVKYVTAEYREMGERLKASGKTRFFGFSCHDGNVVELMNAAADVGGIDAIMFRYSFAQYGDLALNRAIDRCVEAGIGLIAMKTQRSVPADQEEVVQFESRDFSLPQAKLKAVWADERIASAVSHMDNIEKLNENIQAAKSRIKISMHDFQELQRLHRCTSPLHCMGCNHLCESRISGETRVADALRFLMYGESYGELDKAKELYRALPQSERRIDGVDFAAATAACPAGIDIPARLEQARQLLG